ncbi:MAG: divergent polysaccharide deacetylase family protein [Spirochaetia bacterium]
MRLLRITRRSCSLKALQDIFFLVIDDAGYNLDQLQYFLDLQVPLTIAVLPQLGYSEQAAARIQAAGHEAILHLPMEAVSTVNPGPGAVYIDMTAEEIFHTVETNMQSLGIQVAGMNNHMGSKATANANVMNTVLEYIRDNGLFFLDSRTTGDSVINHITQELALPYIKRDVFLDNDTDKEAIHQSFQAGIEIARNEGFVIMIGHVWCQELAEVINEVYPTVEEQGFIFHPLSALYSGTYRNREEGNE